GGRAGDLGRDPSVPTDHVGLGEAEDAELDGGGGVRVLEVIVAATEFVEEGARRFALILVENTEELDVVVLVAFGGGDESRVFLAAGDAPRGPEVHDDDLASKVTQCHGALGFEVGQGDVGSFAADER